MINVCLAFSCVQFYHNYACAKQVLTATWLRELTLGYFLGNKYMLITQSGQQLHTPAHTFILVRTLCWLHSFL